MTRTTAGTAIGAALATIVLVGAVVRLNHLGTQSAWLDEAFSITIANSTPAYILETTSEDVHPPFYYFLLYGWVHLVGGTDWTGRLFSVIVSLGLLPLVYAFGARLRDRRTGLVAAGLLAISPFQIEYAQEARMYALLALLTTAATYCLWRMVETASSPGDETNSLGQLAATGWTIGYAALASMITYTHVHGWFVLAAHACTVTAYVIRRGWQAEPVAIRWVGAMLAVLSVFLIWLPVFTIQVMQVQAGFWIPPPEPDGLMAALQKYAGSTPLLWLLGPLVAWGAWSAGRMKPAGAGRPTPLLFLLPWLVMPLLLPFVVSFVGSSIFLPKYTIAASVPFALLASLGLTRFTRWWQLAVSGALVAYVVSLSIAELRPYYVSVRKDQWREIVTTVEARAEPGDTLIFHPFFTQIPYDFYRHRRDLVEAPFPKHAGQLTTTTLPYVLDQLRPAQGRVWLVLMSFDARKEVLVKALEARYRKVERMKTFHIDAYLCTDPIHP